MTTEIATEENFNELAYLLANPDVAQVVLANPAYSAWRHFVDFGKAEGRMQCVAVMSDVQRDTVLLDWHVPQPAILKEAHPDLIKFLVELGDKPGFRVLELGSREVTAKSYARSQFEHAEYVGFDIYPGENVDVVGDAHHLSTYFPNDVKFDLIFSTAVFEHLAMPWLVAPELAKTLNVGGKLFIETHFSFSSHERPWHFFQFSDMALRSLFSPALGFECIEATMTNPISAKFSSLAAPYLRGSVVPGLYCHSQYLGVKVRDVENFSWSETSLAQATGDTAYPVPIP